MKIEAIVFDMDGVLIDAREWHYEALNKALNLFGFRITRHDHLVTYDGLPTKRKLEMLTAEHGLPRGLHAFLNQLKQKYTMDRVYAECKPCFQHEYALSSLKAQGYKLALASNSVRKTVETMMELSSLSRYLDAILSNEDVQHSKPSPEIYLKSCQQLKVDPKAVMVVEDNINGVNAAKAAGAHVLVVRDVNDVTLEHILAAITKAESTEATECTP